MSPGFERLRTALADRYAIEREIGEGGMATVYLADDLKHERKVALKVLKPELAAVMGAERFLSEIKTTANLQHPHILPLHDSGEADGFLYYVMPYIEGETLGDRLQREKQLPVDEAVRIATDVGEALHSAHGQGVIHRDIKPSNILLSQGRPLVADFGIALAVSAAGGGRLTETGLSMGTPYYMSPEQASADRDPSASSDVYSLGCVLYEMLVGEPPHTGNTAQAVLAKILTERPRLITDVRATVPPNVTAAVARSLERLPADRFESAEHFVRALGDVAFTHELPAITPTQTQASAPIVHPTKRSPVARWLPWSVAAAALVVAVWALRPTPAEPGSPTFRMTLADFVVESTRGGGWRVAISRDGETLVTGGADDLLYLRRSTDTEFRPIPGTEFAQNPSLAPDGAWVVFEQGDALVKVQVTGGPVLPVVAAGGSPHWHTQDEIVFREEQSAYRVSSAGGAPTRIAEGSVGRPFMLPGGRAFLGDGPDGLYLNDLGSGESTLIGPGGSQGRYVPTGHVLYGDRALQTVFALPFDLENLAVMGQPVPVLPSVRIFSGGAVQLAVSDNGTLVHGLGGLASASSGSERLTWIEMDGTRTDLSVSFAGGQVQAPRISPDGTQLAYEDDDVDEIFVLDFNTGERDQVTDVGGAWLPVWSVDGSSLYFSQRGRSWYRTTMDGSEGPVQIGSGGGPMIAVSPDESRVVIEDLSGDGEPNLLVASLGVETLEAQSYLGAEWHEESGVVSPDGDWLAYLSNEGGPHEVYLRAFPEPGPAIRVSSDGGGDPVWEPGGSAIYYVTSDGRMMRREVRLGETAELGEERELFSIAGTRTNASMRMYDIHPDGDRFMFVTFAEVEEVAAQEVQGIGPVVVVVNWFEELRERMGEN
jgi:serine/threonine-protein kinase